MGICTRRHFLLSVCILQLISTVIRQVFDFLGYMWIPILVNFFEIIFIIFGFFGAFQYQPKYVISYSVWNLVLLAWNLFLVCLYLDIGLLSHQNSPVLKLDNESASWWEKYGPGCKVNFNTNTTGAPKPDSVTDCVFNYVHVEVFQASLQCLLALLGCITGICLGSTYLEKDDSFDFLDTDSRTPEHVVMHPLYMNESNPPTRTRRPPTDNFLLRNSYNSGSDDDDATAKAYLHIPVYSAPMSRHLRAHRPQPACRVDRIRSRESVAVRSLSYDRLTFADFANRTDSDTDKARPKSLYNQI